MFSRRKTISVFLGPSSNFYSLLQHNDNAVSSGHSATSLSFPVRNDQIRPFHYANAIHEELLGFYSCLAWYCTKFKLIHWSCSSRNSIWNFSCFFSFNMRFIMAGEDQQCWVSAGAQHGHHPTSSSGGKDIHGEKWGGCKPIVPFLALTLQLL